MKRRVKDAYEQRFFAAFPGARFNEKKSESDFNYRILQFFPFLLQFQWKEEWKSTEIFFTPTTAPSLSFNEKKSESFQQVGASTVKNRVLFQWKEEWKNLMASEIVVNRPFCFNEKKSESRAGVGDSRPRAPPFAQVSMKRRVKALNAVSFSSPWNRRFNEKKSESESALSGWIGLRLSASFNEKKSESSHSSHAQLNIL